MEREGRAREHRPGPGEAEAPRDDQGHAAGLEEGGREAAGRADARRLRRCLRLMGADS